MTSLSDYLEEQKQKTKTSNPLIESILANNYTQKNNQNNKTSLPPSAEVPVSNDLKSYPTAPSTKPSTSTTQGNNFLQTLKNTQKNAFIQNLNTSQSNDFLKTFPTTLKNEFLNNLTSKQTTQSGLTNQLPTGNLGNTVNRFMEESKKAGEEFRSKPLSQQWQEVGNLASSFFVKPAVQFGYSAAKVPSDIVKYLQGVPAEEIAKQGTLDLTKPPKIGQVLPYLIGTDKLSTIQSNAVTNKNDLIKRGASPALANTLAAAQAGLEALTGASWALQYGQKGAELLQKLAPNADEISAWATLKYPQNSEELKANYYQLAHDYHPDRGGNPADFKQIQKAYETLSKSKFNLPLKLNDFNFTLQKIGTALLSPVSQFNEIMGASPYYGVSTVNTNNPNILRLTSKAGETPVAPYQPSPKVSPLPAGLSTKPVYQSPTQPNPKTNSLEEVVKSLVGKTNEDGTQILSITPVKEGYIANIKTPAGQVLPSGIINKSNIDTFVSQYYQVPQAAPAEANNLIAQRNELLNLNKSLEARLEELEPDTPTYNSIDNQIEQNGKKIAELTDKINKLKETEIAKPQVQPQSVEKEAKLIPKELESFSENLITSLTKAKQSAQEPKLIQDIIKKIKTPASQSQIANPIINKILQSSAQLPANPITQLLAQPSNQPVSQPIQLPASTSAQAANQIPIQLPNQSLNQPALPSAVQPANQPVAQTSAQPSAPSILQSLLKTTGKPPSQPPIPPSMLPNFPETNDLINYVSEAAKQLDPIIQYFGNLQKVARSKVVPTLRDMKTAEDARKLLHTTGKVVGELKVSEQRGQAIQEALKELNSKYAGKEDTLIQSLFNIANADPASNIYTTATAADALDRLLHGQDIVGHQLSALGKTISIYNRNVGENLQTMGEILSGREVRMSLYHNPVSKGIRTFEQTLTDYFKGSKLFGDIGTLIRNGLQAAFISPAKFGTLLKINAHIFDLKWQQNYALQTATNPYTTLLRTFKGTTLPVETQRPFGFIRKVSQIFGQESFPVRILSADKLTLSNSIDTAGSTVFEGALKFHDPIEGLLTPEYNKNVKNLGDQVEIMFQNGFRHDERINPKKWNEFQSVASEAAQFAITSTGYEPMSKKTADILSYALLTPTKTPRDLIKGIDIVEPFVRFKDPQIKFYAAYKRAEMYASWLLSFIGAGIVLKHYKKGYFDLDPASPRYLRLVFTTGKDDDILMFVVNSINPLAYLGPFIHLAHTYITKSENIHYDITQPEKYYTRDIREFGTKDIYTDFLKLVEYKLNPLLGILVDILKMPTDEFVKKSFLVDTTLDWTPMPIFATNFFENVIQAKTQLEQYGQKLTPEQEKKIWRAFLPSVLGDFVGFSASAYNLGLNQEVRSLMSQQMEKTGSPALSNAVIQKILKAGMKPATYKQMIREVSQTESGIRTPEQLAFGRLPVQTQLEQFNKLPTDKMIEYYPMLNRGAMQELAREINNGIIKPTPRMNVFYLMLTNQLTEDAVKKAIADGVSAEELEKMAKFVDSL